MSQGLIAARPVCPLHYVLLTGDRTRLKAAVAEVNATHDVDSLCKELPARVAQLILAEGGRLAK